MAEPKPQITFGKFQNVDMRVAVVKSAVIATEARFPSRLLELDIGELGTRTSVGQYALVDENDLVGAKVVICVNLGTREMGPYKSEALVLGTPHPDSPTDQSQALPLLADPRAEAGDQVF
jgi:tRNA-binding protein